MAPKYFVLSTKLVDNCKGFLSLKITSRVLNNRLLKKFNKRMYTYSLKSKKTQAR